MGKRVSCIGTRFQLIAAALLLLALVAAGCADRGNASDRENPGGFYTGTSTGTAHP
jgi:hypothetical protein